MTKTKIDGYLDETKMVEVIRVYCNHYDYEFLGTQLKFDWSERFSFDCGYVKNNETVLVEYDGSRHYTDNASIERDRRKDLLVHRNNARIIRVPYWVQFRCSCVFNQLFHDNLEIEQSFPHGFITHTVILPGTFCYAGTKRFMREIHQLSWDVRQQIIASLYWQQDRRNWPADLVFGSLCRRYGRHGMTDTMIRTCEWLDDTGFGNF